MEYLDHDFRINSRIILGAFVWLLALGPLLGQSKPDVSPILGFQLWSTYSQLGDMSSGDSLDLDNGRTNIYIRRVRLGFRANIDERWNLVAVTSFDNYGKDDRSGSLGASSNQKKHPFTFWNMWVRYKVTSNDALYITAGYLPPQVSREANTAFLRIASLEKASSQSYIRRHVVGASHGRSVGINAGGRLKMPSDRFVVNYNVGIFNPHTFTAEGSSGNLMTFQIGLESGQKLIKASPILMPSFFFEGQSNFQLSSSGSLQENDLLQATQFSYGVDMSINYRNMNLSAEWYILGTQKNNEDALTTSTGFLRLGYNHKMENERFLHPVVTFSGFVGAKSIDEQLQASALGMDSGEDLSLEFALNYYFNKKVRAMVAYTHRWGDQGENPNTVRTNEYFFQKGVGYFNRPNYWAIGLLAEI